MDEPRDLVDIRRARSTAAVVAAEWGLSLFEPFALSRFSFVAPVVGVDAVLKTAWEGDDESSHEAKALALWGGDGAVRLLRHDPARRALLLERALPGSDVSDLDFLVHGDFHHHNVLRHGDGFVAIDPKPYLADREYDVYPWLRNPLPYRMTRGRTGARIARFVAAGLDERRIRAWAVIRGAYLSDDPEEHAVLGGLI